jgi:hypothetical protein
VSAAAIATGTIVSKDVAADWVLARLAPDTGQCSNLRGGFTSPQHPGVRLATALVGAREEHEPTHALSVALHR